MSNYVQMRTCLRDLRKLGWQVEMRARNGVRGHNEYRATKEAAK